MRWFFFLFIAALSWWTRILSADQLSEPAGSALLGLGCLIIGGALAGDLTRHLGTPRITGYLVLGLVLGPFAAGVVTRHDGEFLRLFEELALGLIALTAGGEFRLAAIRRHLKSILAITASHCVLILSGTGFMLWLLLQVFPFMGAVSPAQELAVALLLGLVAVAVSPATTIAVISETRARGELVDTVLGVTILKDLLVLLLFTWAEAIAISWVQDQPASLELLKGLGIEIVLSLAVGALLGLVLGAYLAIAKRHVALTVLLLALVSVELAHASNLEHLLICLSTGFVARNLFPRRAGAFLDGLEESSAPIYTIFFALVGASLNLAIFAVVWFPAAALVTIRLCSIWLWTRLPALAVRASPLITRHAWTGFIGQAGISLGFASRITHHLPNLGPAVATIIIAAVVVNQLIGPVLWARALWASGEARS